MSTVITNSIVNFVVQQSKGNEKSIHHNLCELGKVPTDSVICTSLAWKAKCVTKEITRLKKYTDRSLLRNYLKETFCFPVSRSRQPNRNQLEKENLQLKGRIIILENELTKAEKKGKEQKLRELNRKIKRDRHTIIRQKEELSKLKKRKSALSETSTQCDLLDLQRKNQILSLKQQLSALEFELSEKEEQPVEKKNDIDFDIRENSKGRPYNPKLRELYYVFRSCNVPCHHTNKLICAVLDLVHIDLCKDDLPSPTLIKQFTYEMGTVAAQQLKEELATASNLTMHRDATTKKGHHYYGVEFSTGEKTLTAGIRETCDAKATTYVNATEHIMDTIDSSATILENVSTYMTDRSSTECKVNTLLTEKTDHDIREMKCAAHPVLNLSEVCEKWMKEFENQVQIPNKLSFCSKSEGIVYTFIKVVSKLFFKDGSGDPKFARLYMEQKGLDIPLLNFRGNRFNILFHNAAGVIVLASEIQEYLESAKCTINRSQNFILQCLQCPNIINVCIALGIIFRIILNPYWTIVSAAKAKAIDMGPVYNFLIAVLQNAIDDPESLVMNRLRLLPGPCNKLEGDALFNVEHENNEVLKNAVKGLCSAMHGKCLSLFKDFISGGKYTNIDMSSAESCPATNITNERLFARLDNKKHTAPTMTTAAIEATIMYSGNKTAEWLSDKNISDKIQIIGNAVKSKKQHMKQISLENEHLKQQNVQVIEERKKIVTKRQEKVKNANDILTYDLESIGLWCSADVVEQELQQLKTKKDKLSALKKQLNMDKEIFNIQEKDKNLLFVSKKGKPISLEIIKEHHLKLIEIYHSQLDVDIVGKLIKHTWSDSSGEETVWKGKVLSCDKGVFKIQYWTTNPCNDDDDVFVLTSKEVREDIESGSLILEEDD